MSKPIEITHDERGYHVMLNGVDLASAIAAGGLRIEWQPGNQHPIVTMQLRQAELNAHLPEATLHAVGELQAEHDARIREEVANQSCGCLGYTPIALPSEPTTTP